MLSLREKVADKLSRLLADSPSSSSSPKQEVPFSPPSSAKKSSTFSSFFLSILPTTCSTDNGFESNKPRAPKPLKSLPRKWKINAFSWKDKPVDCTSDTRTETSDDASDNISNHEPSTSQEFQNCLTEESTFISADLFEFLQASLPNIVRGCKWVLLYSTTRHGISLQTLLRRSVDVPGPCVLIVGDMQGAVFGGLLDCPLKTTSKRKYQGTNQTFVFTTIYGEPRLFRPTGANRYYYLCLNDVLAFGGGGNFALSLDEDLLHGTSGPCETFGNLCLARTPEFELKNVELWGFTHSSRYLPN